MNPEHSPKIWTRSALRNKAALLNAAQGRGGIRLIILEAAFGAGKTVFLDLIYSLLQWPFPANYYVRQLEEGEDAFHSEHMRTADEILDFFLELGVLPADMETEADAYLTHLSRRGKDMLLTPQQCLAFMDWVLERTNAAAPDPLRVMPLFGLRDAPRNRCPIRVTGEIADRPPSIVSKLLGVLLPPGAPRVTWLRSMYVVKVLKLLPCILLVDEADTLSVACLEELRQITDMSQTPLVLAGTRTLIARLETSNSLRALATRAGARVTLEPVSVADLRGACPEMKNDVLLEVWKASKRNFRVAMLIVGILRLMQEAYPGRALTKSAVMRAAEEVLAADAARVGRGRGGDADAVSDVELPEAAEAGEEAPVDAVAMQAAGRRR